MSVLRGGKLPSRGNLSPSKRFHKVLVTCRATFEDEIEAQTRMGQWWMGTFFDQSYLGAYIHGPLFKLSSYFRTPRTDLGWASGWIAIFLLAFVFSSTHYHNNNSIM